MRLDAPHVAYSKVKKDLEDYFEWQSTYGIGAISYTNPWVPHPATGFVPVPIGVLEYSVKMREIRDLIGLHRMDILACYYLPEQWLYKDWTKIARRYRKRDMWPAHEVEMAYWTIAKLIYPQMFRRQHDRT